MTKAEDVIRQELLKRKKVQPPKEVEDNDTSKDILNETEKENGNNVMS